MGVISVVHELHVSVDRDGNLVGLPDEMARALASGAGASAWAGYGVEEEE